MTKAGKIWTNFASFKRGDGIFQTKVSKILSDVLYAGPPTTSAMLAEELRVRVSSGTQGEDCCVSCALAWSL